MAARPVSLRIASAAGGYREEVYALNGAAETAVCELEPFFDLLTPLGDGKGFFDVGG